jgi:hypothetical protein
MRNLKFSPSKIFTFDFFGDNISDIGIVILQLYCFASKLLCAELANINPRIALDKNYRNIHYPFFFLAFSFHAIIIIELLTLFLISGKIW